MLSSYQLKIANYYNILIGNVKQLVPNFFDKENMCSIMKICAPLLLLHLQLYMRLGLKLKQIRRVLEFNQPQWLKPYAEFNTKKRLEAEKHGRKNRKALYRLMSNVLYGETMENLRNRIDVRLVSNKRDYIKWTSKSSYMSQKIFDNDLVAIRKSKVTLSLNFSAYIGMYILDLTKVLIYEFHCDYFENKYVNNTRPLFTDTHSLMYETKPKNVYEDFSKYKEMFDFSNYNSQNRSQNIVMIQTN